MFGKKFIRIERVSVTEGQILVRFSCSRRIRKYFSSDTVSIQYDVALDDVSESILVIPAVSVLLPVAWATGANLYVEELDKNYLKSLEKIKVVMKRWYPTFSFDTKIFVQKKITNEFSNKEHGLLFSGGLDSVTSYIQNRDLKPHLISVWGLDVLLKKETLWKKIKDSLSDFARKEEVPIHFIKSNIRQLIYEPLLSIDFGYSWWVRVSHGLTTISLCAPLTAKGIGTLIIASTRGPHHSDKERYPLGSSPLIDNKLSWADVKVVHDGYELNRQQKIKYVLKEFVETEYHPLLRVCTNAVNDLNCSQCNKCLETMTGLVLDGIDPNKCGFKITDKTLESLKQKFLNHSHPVFEHEFVSSNFKWRTDDWKEIQNEIPENINDDLYNSREFFEWLRRFDLMKYGNEMEKQMRNAIILDALKFRLNSCLLSLANMLPKQSQDLMKHLFNNNVQHKKF